MSQLRAAWGKKKTTTERQLYLSLSRKWVTVLCHFHSSAATAVLLPQRRLSTGWESACWCRLTPEAGIRRHVKLCAPEVRRSEAPVTWNDAGAGMEIPTAFSANLIFSWAKKQKTHPSSSTGGPPPQSVLCLPNLVWLWEEVKFWDFYRNHGLTLWSCAVAFPTDDICPSLPSVIGHHSYENEPFSMSQVGPLRKMLMPQHSQEAKIIFHSQRSLIPIDLQIFAKRQDILK